MKNQVHFARNWLRAPLLWAALFALLTGLAGFFPQAVDAQNRYQLKIQNDSRYDIYHLYVSSSEEEHWGPDQLGDHVLESDTSYTLTDIVPGEYDIKFVDEDGDACVLRNVKIFQNTSWSLTTKWLARCEGYR